MQDSIKRVLSELSNAELIEVNIYVEGLVAGRATGRVPSIHTPKPPRKSSTCSICHQPGHRAPNCPEKPAA